MREHIVAFAAFAALALWLLGKGDGALDPGGDQQGLPAAADTAAPAT